MQSVAHGLRPPPSSKAAEEADHIVAIGQRLLAPSGLALKKASGPPFEGGDGGKGVAGRCRRSFTCGHSSRQGDSVDSQKDVRTSQAR